ncbi:uncharacterized protein LOC127286638 [Leptopilina boulardi]|uniref:uncharacterized protein LOC127286638 n=1 Tax=Leptopilina boulardi TaxID=63433 RepID=UPI0021F5FE88|nr:uncharacterized protein LOC127286638 [Leptopilina boulardi]
MRMLKQICNFFIVTTFLINGIISFPSVVEESINSNVENNIREHDENIKENKSKHSIEEIQNAVYFPPSNGNLMHHITVRIKNDVNNTKNCAIKVWRENSTDSPITIECDEELREKRNVSPNPNSPTKLNTNDDDVKKFATIGVEKYAHTMVNSSASSLEEIIDAYSYPSGHSLYYKIKIQMNNCNGKEIDSCRKMKCIVYVWRERILDHPVSIECDPIVYRRKRIINPLVREYNEINNLFSRRMKREQDLNIDDPEIRKYVDIAVEGHESPVPNAKDKISILLQFKEATSYPHGDKLRYKIKLRIGNNNCTKGSDDGNCSYDSQFGHDDCEINVYREDNKERVETQCSRIGRRKRQVSNLPSVNLSMDDPDIRKYIDEVLKNHVSSVDKAEVKKLILRTFEEALSQPSAIKIRYEIKLTLGTSNGSKETDCIYDSEIGNEINDPEPLTEKLCSKILRRKRKVNNSSTNLNMDDPEIKKYVDIAVEGHESPVPKAKYKSSILLQFKEATLYPPGDKLRYKIKMRIGNNNCTKGSSTSNCIYDPQFGHDDCEINVYRDDYKEWVETQCSRIGRRKRNLPSVNLNMDDPEIRKYIDMVVDKHVSPVASAKDKTSILHEFRGAKSYPPSDKIQYKINLRIGSSNCTKGTNDHNCQYNDEFGYSDCEIDVFRETNMGPAVTTLCSRID